MEVVKAGITLRTQDSVPGHKAETRPDTIAVTALAEVFELTVPVSQLVRQIPRGGLRQAANATGGAAENPRYFSFIDEQNLIFVSGWFEHQDLFKGIDKFWADELAGWMKAMPKPERMSFKKASKWEVVVYNIPNDLASFTNLRAHWLQAGTWIDLHLSMMSKLPKAGAIR